MLLMNCSFVYKINSPSKINEFFDVLKIRYIASLINVLVYVTQRNHVVDNKVKTEERKVTQHTRTRRHTTKSSSMKRTKIFFCAIQKQFQFHMTPSFMFKVFII